MQNKKKKYNQTSSSKLVNATLNSLQWYYIFCFLIIYSFIFVRRFRLPSMEDVVYSFHAVDYSMGLVSCFLPGAIFNFFFRQPTLEKAVIYESLLLLVFFAILSIWLAKISQSLIEKNRPLFLLVALFFITGPCTFSIFSYQIGMLDVYWIFFSVLFFLLLSNKYAKWAIPLVGGACVLVHFGAILSYVLLFAIILLYRITTTKEKKERRGFIILLWLTCIVSTGLCAYLIANKTLNLTYSMEDFDQLLLRRGANNSTYYDIEAYNAPIALENLIKDGVLDEVTAQRYVDPKLITLPSAPFIENLINKPWKYIYEIFILYRLEAYQRLLLRQLFLYAILSPLLIILYRFLIRMLKNQRGNNWACLFCFCAITVFPFISLTTVLFSTDRVRWMAHAFIILCTIIIYIFYREKDFAIQLMFPNGIQRKMLPFILVYLLLYITIIFDPYLIIKQLA